MPLPPPCGPLVYLAQAIPGDYRIGDVVFSLVSFSDKHGSFEPGAKGTVVSAADSGTDPDEKLLAEFEGYGNKINMRLTSISREDPNDVGEDYCAVAALCLLGRLGTQCCMIHQHCADKPCMVPGPIASQISSPAWCLCLR